jgi:hypothetical protein
LHLKKPMDEICAETLLCLFSILSLS